MKYKDFIKLEAKVLLQIVKDEDTIFELLFKDGLAEELRFFAEKNNYDISEEDLKNIVLRKLYRKFNYV